MQLYGLWNVLKLCLRITIVFSLCSKIINEYTYLFITKAFPIIILDRGDVTSCPQLHLNHQLLNMLMN
ncbi:unnamed protein product [Acanthoscelides obtectus]|uniref:Uncharacterized protein n=1 Tax=Acanthoscelides obtectus TaxID=200917 RepID=A0A9P0PPV9_ACAOB|nr:unnamed protein product [Acanthoscelides obtectus]CAK1681559.1 hypothetical protein AOBTE_LOCUS33162 [Acanthoscelides obtectus]